MTLHKLLSQTCSKSKNTYDPLPIEGIAIDLMFFSSANVNTLLTAFSRFSTEESFSQGGL